MQTSGINIARKNTFPNSMMEVATAIPAFVGYTEKAIDGNVSLKNVPYRITSLKEFQTYFGGLSNDSEESVEGIESNVRYTLYYHMLLFYANGGNICYIVSVGDYSEKLSANLFIAGIDALLKVSEPAILVIPEAVNLNSDDCYKVQRAMLKHCGNDTKRRVAILDVYDGDKCCKGKKEVSDIIQRFWAGIGNDYLSYGAAYYPWGKVGITERKTICLPMSAAIAGVYVMTDNSHGVWKAPVNKKIVDVMGSTVCLSCDDWGDIRLPLNGKCINTVCTHGGEDTLVWGACTLDGNSPRFRYINVRRTIIMLEESIKNVAKTYELDPNHISTWKNLRSTICHFLRAIWKKGGLSGCTPEEAYNVYIGVGETMVPEDIRKGVMNIKVKVAITRPEEFIEIDVQQRMQQGE
jgi:phage tail sheath protein FI